MELAFISPPDMIVVMIVALVVFGPKRLPEVGRQIGTLMRDMRKMMGQFTEAVEDVHSEFKPLGSAVQSVYNKPDYKAIPDDELMKPYDQREAFLLTQKAEPLSLSTLPPLESEVVEPETTDEEAPQRAH